MRLKYLFEDWGDDDRLLNEKSNTIQAKSEGENWIKKNPVHHMNVVNHYHQATHDEIRHGMNWYSDAHSMVKAIANDTGTPHHVMAGLVANYSPQNHWFANILTAARVAKDKKAIGGPGSGVMASAKQRDAAHRILHGEHYDNVLKGHKVKAFAHLIEHGENKDPSDPKVVVDRHAFAVASGARVTDQAYSQAGLKQKKAYNTVATAYHKAAEHIRKTHNVDIHPHQLQAITWLVRQRLNAHEERHATSVQGDLFGDTGRSKTKAVGTKMRDKWNDYAKEHHPDVVGMEPGTGYADRITTKRKK